MSDRLRILCFGNPLHGDDGFGHAVALRLREEPLPAGVAVVDCSVRGLDALGEFESCGEVLVVDAVRGERTGRLLRLQPDDVLPENSMCGHGHGLGYLLAAVAATLPDPPRIDVLAVEVATLHFFVPHLSKPVRDAVEEAAACIRSTWLQRERFDGGD